MVGYSNQHSVALQEQNTDQWNRMERLEINLQIYDALIFNKGAIVIRRGKISLFNKWWWEKNWYPVPHTIHKNWVKMD